MYRRLIFMSVLMAIPLFSHAKSSIEKAQDSFNSSVQELSKYIYETNQPYLVWSWFNFTKISSVDWTAVKSTDSKEGFEYFKASAERYFESFCSQDPRLDPKDCGTQKPINYNADNKFGAALYTALDPFSTSNYGGDNENWALLQIQLPREFRVIDLVANNASDGDYPGLPETKKYLRSAGCKTGIELYYIMIDSGTNETPECNLAVRKLLKEGLKVDGFFYRFDSAQSFKFSFSASCRNPDGENFPGRAFIITNIEKINTSNVKVFTSKTRDSNSDRRLLAQAFKKGAGYINDKFDHWSDLNSEKQYDIDAWAKTNIMGCKQDPVPYHHLEN